MTIVLGAPDRVRDGACWPMEEAADACAGSSSRVLTRGRLATALIAAVGMALFVAPQEHANGANSRPALSAATTKPAWIDLAATPRAFALSTGRATTIAYAYAARRRAAGDEREDILTSGVPDGARPYVRLLIHRGGSTADAAPSLFVELARRAAETDLAITRAAQPFLLPTQLGIFEVARVTAAGATRDMACLGFRLAAASQGLAITGVACAGADRPVDAASVACLVDSLALVGPAGDRGLRDLFGKADRRRAGTCAELLADDQRPGPTRPPRG